MNLIHDNARRNQDQEEYERRYQERVIQFKCSKSQNGIVARGKAIKGRYDWNTERLHNFSRRKRSTYIPISTNLWQSTIQDGLVNEDGTIIFKF